MNICQPDCLARDTGLLLTAPEHDGTGLILCASAISLRGDVSTLLSQGSTYNLQQEVKVHETRNYLMTNSLP